MREDIKQELERIETCLKLGQPITGGELAFYMLYSEKADAVMLLPRTKQKFQKPPLGAKPKYIHNWFRLRELGDAITRYVEHVREHDPIKIPTEWVTEYNQLADWLKKDAERSHAKRKELLDRLEGNKGTGND